MNQEIEKLASEEAHRFLNWMEESHGFVPYGFHGDVKRLLLRFQEQTKETEKKEAEESS